MHQDPDKQQLPPTCINLPPPYLVVKPPHQHPQQLHTQPHSEEKIIPGYNFQSLFRKKSHIRLARKRNREEMQKRTPSLKIQPTDKESKNILKGHWSSQQNKLYHWFLELHNRHFIQKHLRRTDKVFKSMAAFITTREAEQCRSHHQKMEKKYLTFHRILEKLRMDHYATFAPEPLKAELEEHGYKLREHSLMSQSELRAGEVRRQQPPQQRSESAELQGSEEQQGSQQGNMLGQNYERRLDFRLQF